MAPRPGLDRDKILTEAIRLGDEVGFAQLGWGQIAQSLGIRPPSLYNHFDSFDALKNAMAVRGVEGLFAAMSQEATLVGMGRAYVRFARSHPALYQASVRAPAVDADELRAAAGRLIALVVPALAPYELPDSLVVHALRVFRSTIHGFVSIEASGGFGLPESLDTTLEALLATLAAGLGHLKEKEELV